MMTNKNTFSFGRYLKDARLEKGIKLEEVSIQTRISKDQLRLIEMEDVGNLPDEVFVKGFLRAYAKAVGADEDIVVQSYLASLNAFKETAKIESDLIKSDKKFRSFLVLSLGVLFCIVVLSIIILSVLKNYKTSDNQLKQEVSKNKIDPDKHVIFTETYQGQDSAKENFVNIPNKLLMKILTIEKTWIRITIDKQKSKEYSLNPGDRLELEASSGFNILIGNATGVLLTIDDKTIEIPGKKGQVANIRIP